MNWEAIGVIVAVISGLATAIYSLTKDNKSWINTVIRKQEERIDRAENTHKAFAEQQAIILRDFYTPRRDFDEHKAEQRQDMAEFKSILEDVRREVSGIPDIVVRRMNK